MKQCNEEFEKEHRRVLLMKNNFGGLGKRYEDTAGAAAIGASGDPVTRSDHAVSCVTDLIDHTILKT